MSGEEREDFKITKEQWITLLKDRNVIKEQDIELLQLLFNCKNCEAPASQLAHQLDKSHHGPINKRAASLGERIVKKLNISAPKRTDGSSMWWHVPFLGEPKGDDFYWKLRPELQTAMEFLYETKSAEEVDVNRYERSRGARDRCVEIYGSKCSICGFDFEEKYGEVGKDVIHVHHLTPLSQTGEEYEVDPKNDLRPVCANCHMIIHKKENPPYSIEEVKAMLTN